MSSSRTTDCKHLRLGRDCEIVVIDGARGFGNGRVLPAGPLREPLARLPQPDAVVMNGAPEHGSLTAALPTSPALAMRLVAQEAVRLDGRESPRALQRFGGQRVHAVAGSAIRRVSLASCARTASRSSNTPLATIIASRPRSWRSPMACRCS